MACVPYLFCVLYFYVSPLYHKYFSIEFINTGDSNLAKKSYKLDSSDPNEGCIDHTENVCVLLLRINKSA